MKNKLLVLLMAWPLLLKAEVVMIDQNQELKLVLDNLASDLGLSYREELGNKLRNTKVRQNLNGNSLELLHTLSDIYKFDWYINGGELIVMSGQRYISHIYNTTNIEVDDAISQVRKKYKSSTRFKVEKLNNTSSISLSGPTQYVQNVIKYLMIIDEASFLSSQANKKIERIKFSNKTVNDRVITSLSGSVTSPGAASIIASALNQNKGLKEIDKANSEEINLKSSSDLSEISIENNHIFILPEINSLLVKGSEKELEFAKSVAKLIDKKQKQILFTLKVYDIASQRQEQIGPSPDSSAYEFVSLPINETKKFLEGFDLLYRNGQLKTVHETQLLTLENQQGTFGKSETVTLSLISDKQVETKEIKADNSLYVTGQITSSGQVKANLSYIEESLGKNSELPSIQSQGINTEVYINPGETVVLGGFNRTNVEVIETGVPILSSIPLIGLLFSHTDESKTKSRRYISVSFEEI